MKKWLLLIVVVLLASCVVQAATVEISWQPVTLDVEGNTETIGYYILYYGLAPRPGNVSHPSDSSFQYDSVIEVGKEVKVQRSDLLGDHRYYFSVAAVDTMGNVSDYSKEVSLDISDNPEVDPTVGPDDNLDGGCGCAGVGLGGSLWFLGLVLLMTRRRRWMVASHTTRCE